MKDLEVKINFLSKQNIKLCKQTENAEEILSQHEAYISLLENKNQQLKELLKQSLRYVWTVRNDVRTEFAGATNEQIDMLIENIDNAIGENK